MPLLGLLFFTQNGLYKEEMVRKKGLVQPGLLCSQEKLLWVKEWRRAFHEPVTILMAVKMFRWYRGSESMSLGPGVLAQGQESSLIWDKIFSAGITLPMFCHLQTDLYPSLHAHNATILVSYVFRVKSGL